MTPEQFHTELNKMKIIYIIGIVLNIIICLLGIVKWIEKRDLNELVIAVYAASAVFFILAILKSL